MSQGINVRDFLSEYLNGDDVNGQPLNGKIIGLSTEDVTNQSGKSRPRIIISVDCHKKKIILNNTSMKALAKSYGQDASQWLGKEVAISSYAGQAFGEIKNILHVAPG